MAWSSWKDFFFGRKSTTATPTIDDKVAAPYPGDGTDPECPVDRQQLGRSTWTLLHTLAAYVPDSPSWRERRELKQFMGTLSNFYPCRDCGSEMQKQLKREPPAVSSREEFSQWMCRLHNEVNERLGKPKFDCSKVDERWRDGWKDGRCD